MSVFSIPFSYGCDGETGPSEDDRLSVKRELENQDSVSAQKMYQLLQSQYSLALSFPSYPRNLWLFTFSHAYSPCPGTHGDGPGIGVIKRDPVTQPMQRREHGPSRNTGSGPQSPTTSRDQDRDSNRSGYRPTSSYSNSTSWRDHNERGGRERERERDDRAWRGDSQRGRESVPGGGDRKRYFGHPDGRGSGDRRECKHLCFYLFSGPPSFLFFTTPFFSLISRGVFLLDSWITSPKSSDSMEAAPCWCPPHSYSAPLSYKKPLLRFHHTSTRPLPCFP